MHYQIFRVATNESIRNSLTFPLPHISFHWPNLPKPDMPPTSSIHVAVSFLLLIWFFGNILHKNIYFICFFLLLGQLFHCSSCSLVHRLEINIRVKLCMKIIQSTLILPTLDTTTKFVILTIRLTRKPSLNQKLCRKIIIQYFKQHMFWIFVRTASSRQF